MEDLFQFNYWSPTCYGILSNKFPLPLTTKASLGWECKQTLIYIDIIIE